MKRPLLFRVVLALLALLGLAAFALAQQQPRNIHQAYNDLIISNWDHKSPKIKRYDPPASLVELERAMNDLFATGDDATRPWRGFVSLMLVRPDLHPAEGAYRLPELWRLNYLAQEGGKFMFHAEIDTKLLQQIRLTRGNGSDYTLLVDDTQPGHLALLPRRTCFCRSQTGRSQSGIGPFHQAPRARSRPPSSYTGPLGGQLRKKVLKRLVGRAQHGTVDRGRLQHDASAAVRGPPIEARDRASAPIGARMTHGHFRQRACHQFLGTI